MYLWPTTSPHRCFLKPLVFFSCVLLVTFLFRFKSSPLSRGHRTLWKRFSIALYFLHQSFPLRTSLCSSAAETHSRSMMLPPLCLGINEAIIHTSFPTHTVLGTVAKLFRVTSINLRLYCTSHDLKYT